jgi:predicted Rossmann-fold nucleotide-binding protein
LLAHLLDQISREENADDRGMLSVVVVYKDGDMQPGNGFYKLGKQLGKDTSDKLLF